MVVVLRVAWTAHGSMLRGRSGNQSVGGISSNGHTAAAATDTRPRYGDTPSLQCNGE